MTPLASGPAVADPLLASRADFPPLERFVWFQNGGVSLVPSPVHELHISLLEEAFQRGQMHISWPAEEYPRRDASRARIARFLGVETDEIAIVRGVSEAFQHVLRGRQWTADDEIVMTADEEGALLVPALQLAQERGVHVRLIPLGSDSTAQELLAAAVARLTPRTRLLAISHVTTDWGIRLPVTEICAAAEARGVPTFVDTAHSAGVMPADLHAMGCSYAGVLSYKWLLAPYAAGALYVRRDRLEELPVVYAGGRAEASLSYAEMRMELQPGARRFEFGPWSWPLIHAWARAIDYVDELGVPAIQQRTGELTDRLKAGLVEIPGVTLHTPRDHASSAALVAFGIDGWAGPALEAALRDRFRIVVRALTNVRSGVRASVALFTADAEVDVLLDAIRALAAR